MKTKEILTKEQLRVADHALCGGWDDIQGMIDCEAGLYRVATGWDIWVERCDSELWETKAPTAPTPVKSFSNDHPESKLILFSDGSLYNVNNAESEVWSDANDFIAECGGIEALESDYPNSDTYRLAAYLVAQNES